MAERFFQHDARLGCIQAGGSELFADRGEQRRSSGHIHDDGVGVAVVECFGQCGIVVRFGQVHADKVEQGGKAREFLGTGALGEVDLVKTRLNQAAVLFLAEIVTSNTDNATAFAQGAVPECLK